LEFNEAQKQAIQHDKGPCMVIAGPGSGKTAVLTNRVKYLIGHLGVSPSDILVITFTKAAAVQMKARFSNISEGKGTAVTFGTFHAVFFTILKNAYNYSSRCIIKAQNQYNFVRDELCMLELEYDDETEAVNNVLSQISLVKNGQKDIDSYQAAGIPEGSFRRIYNRYMHMLTTKGLLDFDDMVIESLKLLKARDDYRKAWQDKYRYILIDEFQDINMAQFEVICILADKYKNLFVVGDDDQSIYGFRGASPSIMFEFSQIYTDARKIYLDINYRSSANIVMTGRAIIEENQHRFAKNIRSSSVMGEPVNICEFLTYDDEQNYLVSELKRLNDSGVDYDDIAVLSRTNVVGDTFMTRAVTEGIPCVGSGKAQNLYDHWISKDIISYLNIAMGSCRRNDYLRVINKPMRYITRSYVTDPFDMQTLKSIYNCNEAMAGRINDFEMDMNMIKNMSPFAAINYIRKKIGYDRYIDEYIYEHRINREAIYGIISQLQNEALKYITIGEWMNGIARTDNDTNDEKEERGVHFITMHGSKGLEYRAVFVVDVCEGIIPYSKAVLDKQIEEERRLFYVAVTRAKEKLYLMYPKKRYNKDTACSRFLEDIITTTRYPLLRTVLHTP